MELHAGSINNSVPSVLSVVFFSNQKIIENLESKIQRFIDGIERDGVYRYHNRNPPDDLKTRDHRLVLIKKGDVRDALRSSVSELPDAPVSIAS